MADENETHVAGDHVEGDKTVVPPAQPVPPVQEPQERPDASGARETLIQGN